jgi:phosphoenolpyruvate carboxylase
MFCYEGPSCRGLLFATACHCNVDAGAAQVSCLKTLRALEAGKNVDELVPADYKPSEKALALMSRGASKHPFVAGIEDTLIITMKGIASGLKNTG